MKKYLRQETLFSTDHFDTYLCEAREWKEGEHGKDEGLGFRDFNVV
jgi:hypothetical protein